MSEPKIEDIVGQFSRLRQSGDRLYAACPFHSDSGHSLVVDPKLNLAVCVQCGKGGSPVSFVMELEHMNYPEAQSWLSGNWHTHTFANYSPQGKLFKANAFALNYFRNALTGSDEGRRIALSYFHERGLSDSTISKFQLGYAPDNRDQLIKEAEIQQIPLSDMLTVGLIGQTDKNELYDRFRGRVIYPVFNLSGRPVAFGGRIMRSGQFGGKYVNSPDSSIYSKTNELYGLYHARQAIEQKDCCILVEGYMDVLSMAQNGIENVVASSGTALTAEQVLMIKRFTSNVIVIYDSDAAGEKAALRSIAMFLSKGFNLSIVRFPEGDDPDSYARSHSPEELRNYLETNSIDFISFITESKLKSAANDPMMRATVTAEIVGTIAVIPDMARRTSYISKLSRMLKVDERVIAIEVSKKLTENILHKPAVNSTVTAPLVSNRQALERRVVRLIVRYGMLQIPDNMTSKQNVSVVGYIIRELTDDDISLEDHVLTKIINEAISLSEGFSADSAAILELLERDANQIWNDGLAEIQATAKSMSEIRPREEALKDRVDTFRKEAFDEFEQTYLLRRLTNSLDDEVRREATTLAFDRHHLSRIHTKYSKIESEADQLDRTVQRTVYELKNEILKQQMNQLRLQISNIDPTDSAQLSQLMDRYQRMARLTADFSKLIGDRVINP